MSRYDTLLDSVVGAAKLPFVQRGYGQVEPNHLSAQRTGQIYAQLPADASINVLQQGQFVKYDYAEEVCNFTGPGEWMLVFNEIKLYREGQNDCEFAMVKDNYNARVYSPYGADKPAFQSRYYNGEDDLHHSNITLYRKTKDTEYDGTKTYYTKSGDTYTAAVITDAFDEDETYYEKVDTYNYDKVTTAPNDMYELFQTDDPFANIVRGYTEKKMVPGTKMVPRVFKTNIGDIFTTNTVGVALTAADVGEKLYVGDNGILTKTKKNSADDNGAASGTMEWQIVKFYTMPDGQPGVKIMRIA